MKGLFEHQKVRSSVDYKKLSLKERIKARLGFKFLEFQERVYLQMNPERFPAGQFFFSELIRGIFDTPQIIKVSGKYYIEYLDEGKSAQYSSDEDEGKDLRAEQFILARIFKDPDHSGDNTISMGAGVGSAIFDLEFMPGFFMENSSMNTEPGSWSLQRCLETREDKYSERLRGFYTSKGPFRETIKMSIALLGHQMNDGSRQDAYSYLWVAKEKEIVDKLHYRFIQKDGLSYILSILDRNDLRLDEIMYFTPEQLQQAPKNKVERKLFFAKLFFAVLEKRILYYKGYYESVKGNRTT
jgi:hypothetical protein